MVVFLQTKNCCMLISPGSATEQWMLMLSSNFSRDRHTVHATKKCLANQLTEQKYTRHISTHIHTHIDDISITWLKCPSTMTRWLVHPLGYVYELYYVIIIPMRKYYT